jgi:hypothetical protein
MKHRHVVFISLFFVGLMALSASTVYQYMTGRKVLSIASDLTRKKASVVVTTEACSTKKPITGLATTKSAALKKLNTYQQACHSYVTDTLMTFVGFPVSQASAAKQAGEIIGTLKDFSAKGITPLVMAEPTDYDTSENIDFAKFAAGNYTKWLDEYFAAIKAAGITDKQMGIWNPYPEANLPYWNNNLPEHFAPGINVYITSLRKHFPQARTSIMLNSATYETTDFNWQNGEYTSLLKYVKGITPGTIDYAGLEGFPWIPPAGGNGPILNAADFLNPDIIDEAADYLKTKNIWFNTGTFATKYALDATRKAHLTPEQRRTVLATINAQALLLEKKGYNVAVCIFAEDKSHTPEETDWSYWSGNNPFSSPATPVFTQFVAKLHDEKVDFWLFDK